ncbi:hypothetical protein GQR58_013352 [Nymphon striatum]|nr:hypothetical protein GQR58_013352 [Nymphon striatum]
MPKSPKSSIEHIVRRKYEIERIEKKIENRMKGEEINLESYRAKTPLQCFIADAMTNGQVIGNLVRASPKRLPMFKKYKKTRKCNIFSATGILALSLQNKDITAGDALQCKDILKKSLQSMIENAHDFFNRIETESKKFDIEPPELPRLSEDQKKIKDVDVDAIKNELELLKNLTTSTHTRSTSNDHPITLSSFKSNLKLILLIFSIIHVSGFWLLAEYCYVANLVKKLKNNEGNYPVFEEFDRFIVYSANSCWSMKTRSNNMKKRWYGLCLHGPTQPPPQIPLQQIPSQGRIILDLSSLSVGITAMFGLLQQLLLSY